MRASSFDSQKPRFCQFDYHQQDEYYLGLVLQHYQNSLLCSSRAKRFLIEQLGLGLSTAEKFGIGYCDRSLGHKLPPLETFDGERIRGALQRSGLIKGNGRERFRGALILPIHSENKVVDVFGYWIGNNLRKNRSKTDTIYPSSSALFNSNCMANHTSVFLSMEPFDVLQLSELGIPNAISTLGTTRFDDGHLAQLLERGIQQVYVLQMNTQESRRFERNVKRSLDAFGLAYQIVSCPCSDNLYRALAVKSLVIRQLTNSNSSKTEVLQ